MLAFKSSKSVLVNSPTILDDYYNDTCYHDKQEQLIKDVAFNDNM